MNTSLLLGYIDYVIIVSFFIPILIFLLMIYKFIEERSLK